MEKALIAAIGIMLGLTMVVAVTQMIQAAEPVPQYSCPLCPETFMTYDELYNHFVTEHPAEPIDIIWE